MGLCAEFLGCLAGVAFEVAGEGGLVREAEAVTDLLNGHLAVMLQQVLGLDHYIACYQLACAVSQCLTDNGAEVFGGEAEEVGIELYVAMPVIVFGYGCMETEYQLLYAVLLLWLKAVFGAVDFSQVGHDVQLRRQQFVPELVVDGAELLHDLHAGFYAVILQLVIVEGVLVVVDVLVVVRVHFGQIGVEAVGHEEYGDMEVFAGLYCLQYMIGTEQGEVMPLKSDGVKVIFHLDIAAVDKGYCDVW